MKIIYSILLCYNILYSIVLDKEQLQNAQYIYSKNYNKDYATFLIALGLKESSLRADTIRKCDLKYKDICYDSIGLFQFNLHTAKLFYPSVSQKSLRRLLKTKYFNLKFANKLLKHNAFLTSKIQQNNIINESFIKRVLQIYNGGVYNKDTKYANDVYKKYMKLKKDKSWL
jgi:hypothetical protein